METVTHHGRETAYRVHDRGGSGTPLCCVHGSGGSHAVWKGQARMADERPVVALDLSGHGESEDVDSDPGYTTLAAYADDVLAVAEETGAGAFAGNSLGGAVLLHAAIERGFDPEALVLTGTGARLRVLDDLLSWLEDDFDRAVEFLHGEGRLFADASAAQREVSKAGMRECGQAVTHRDFRTCHTFDVRDDLATVTTPTLALVGEHDQLTPRAYHEYLAEELPNGRLGVVEDAAHLAMLEEPAAFNAAVSAFLAE